MSQNSTVRALILILHRGIEISFNYPESSETEDLFVKLPFFGSFKNFIIPHLCPVKYNVQNMPVGIGASVYCVKFIKR